MRFIVIAALIFLPLPVRAMEVLVEGGRSAPVVEAFANGDVLPSTLRMISFRFDHAQLYYGEVVRVIEGDLAVRANGEPVVTADFKIPIRFGFLGADALAESDGWFRAGASAGLAVFDKVDKATDGTAWRFHFGLWISVGREFIISLGAHHFSNGENTPLKTRGPNIPLEFLTLGAGLTF